MAKKSSKGKSSPGKKQNAPDKQLKSKKQHKSTGGLAMLLVPLVAALAVLFSLLQSGNGNHKPFVGHVARENHKETPVQVEQLSLYPKVFMLRNVLTPSECDELIAQAKQGHRIPSTTGTMSNKTNVDSKNEYQWRRSTTTWLRKDELHASEVVKKLVSRVAAASNVSTASLQRGNPLHVTEYEPDGHYWPHTDSLHLENLDPRAKLKEYTFLDGFIVEGGYPHSARYSTTLCYLSDDFEGGQTIFPLKDGNNKEQPSKNRFLAMQNSKSKQTVGNWETLLPAICDGTTSDGLSIAPEKGSCVLFYNHFIDDDGMIRQLDRLSLHAGCTVRGGKKWITNVWGEIIPEKAIREEARRTAAVKNEL